MDKYIQILNVSKIYNKGKENEVKALNDVQLTINEQDFICIMGPSGSGKSTLLNIISTLDQVSSGQVMIHDVDVNKLSSTALTSFRGKHLGFVFQDYNLLPALSLRDNIALPLAIAKISDNDAKVKIEKISKDVQIDTILDKRPGECSGGQCQRVAIARALVHQPEILMADEPTGNLDTTTAHEILQLLHQLNEKNGITIVMVTHDSMIASYAKKVIFLRDGVIEHQLDRGEKEQTEFYHEIMKYTSKDTINLIKQRNFE